MRIPLAVLHLLALGIGLGAIFARARSLNRVAAGDPGALRSAFAAVMMARGYGATAGAT